MSAPGISGIAYSLPAQRRSLSELAAAGQLQSDSSLLAQFGFDGVHVADEETPYSHALAAATRVLAEQHVPPDRIDQLIYCGTSALAFSPRGSATDAACRLATTRRFQYPATKLQYNLGLERAAAIAVDQRACTSLFAAVRLARAAITAGDARRVLCVSAEFFPECAGREAIFNVTGDAGCAVLVDGAAHRNRIVASAESTKGYYWDADALWNEIIASYFPTAKHVIDETLHRAGWSREDVTWVIPHNVSVRSWQILLGLVGIPRARLWDRNVARIGHTLAGDNFINLRDAIDAGSVRPGDRLLLFSYGYGAHWTALAVEA